MRGAMDTLVFSVVFILVILACFILAFLAVAREERRQRRAEGDRYAPVVAATAPTPEPRRSAVIATAPAPSADARPAHFVPTP